MSESQGEQSVMHILVTGANGQLGRCIADELRVQKIAHTLLGHRDADINDTVVLERLVSEKSVSAVINAAAYTAVDKAESEPELAKRVNHDGPEALAKLCSRFGIPLLHVSTDYVFDGAQSKAYTESDATSPTGVYGKTKLDGEIAVQRHCPQHIILRTAWVFSEYGNNFLKTMLRLGGERDTLGVVADQVGCPTYARDIARALVNIVGQLYSQTHSETGSESHYGIYHYAGNDAVSWHGFAVAIFDQAYQHGLLEKTPIVNAITTGDFPTPAKRPAYSVLSTAKINANFGIPASDWRAGIIAAEHLIFSEAASQ